MPAFPGLTTSADEREDADRAVVLLVAHEPIIREALQFHLARAGFDVLVAPDGGTAMTLARAERALLILVDPLGATSAQLDACRTLRQVTGVPLLLLTVGDDDVERALALEIGADDALSKLDGLRDLPKRIGLLRRRVGARSGDPRLLGEGHSSHDEAES
jgi:two-component system response regulator RegX3